MDFQDIKGQEHVKRGLEVAVAGQHNVIMVCPSLKLAKSIEKRIKTITPDGLRVIDSYSMTPCPCGNFTDPKRECRCMPLDIQRHIASIPADVLEHADIHLEVPRLMVEHLSDKRKGEPSSIIKERVAKIGTTIATSIDDIKLDKEADELLKLAILELGISARAYDKIIKVSRTIARLDDKAIIEAHHLSEAISYRSLDRNLWG